MARQLGRGIQVRPLGVYKTYFWKIPFHFINTRMQHFPFPACGKKERHDGRKKLMTPRGV